AGQRPERAGRGPARHDRHPSGDQGRRRAASRNRGHVMDALSLNIANASAAVQTPKAGGAKDIDATARDFEAVFVSQMLAQMFADVKPEGLGGGGSGERIFRSLMIQEVGRQMTQQGGIGITDTVKRELLAMQEHGGK